MKISDCLFRRGGVFIFFTAFLLAWNSHSAANRQESPFLQRVWQTDQGLPHDSVQAIVQTRDGYLWIGTPRGLARFDGMRFSILDTPELQGNISALCEDRNGDLWIGTTKGVARLKDGTILHYDKRNGLTGDNVRTIYEGKDGTLWIGTTDGLSQFRDGKFLNYNRVEGLPHNVVRSLCEDDLGQLWIATDGGLCRWKDGTISPPETPLWAGGGAKFVCLDGERNLWVGTVMGLYRTKKDGWDYFNKKQSGLSDIFISTIYSDRSGHLWVGTYGGLNRLVDEKFVTELTSEGSSYDLVNCIFEDREGNIWIGSKEGLSRLKPRPFTAITKGEGLTHNNVMSVLQDRSGTFWCGTWGGGLSRWRDEGNTALDIVNLLENRRILSLCDGHDGSLWFGMDFGDGLWRLKDGDLTRHGEMDGLEKVAIRVIYEDRATNLWVGTSVLNLLKDGKITHFTTADGLAGGTIRVILEDKVGDIWVGSANGLSRRRNGKFTNLITNDGLSHNTVLALYEDKESDLWIGTAGCGLNRLRNGQFTAYTTLDGLFNDEVLEILEDDHGYLWMSCLKGVFRVSKAALDKFDRREIDTIPCTSYGKDDGMISIICGNVSKPAAWKGNDGRLWFATTKGLAVADPNVKANDTPPPVVIEEVIADKQTISDPLSRGMLSKNVNPSSYQPLEIPAGRGALEIHYTALSFRASEKNRFKYKLEGVDPDWVDAGTRRVAYYNNLAPGDYKFRVIACNSDGIWNSPGANVELTLQPHYWQTWWFKSFAIIGSLSLVAAGARFVTRRRMERRLARLEQRHAIEKERTRIAQDMHDDLGVRLSEILMLSDMTRKKGANLEEVQTFNGKISQAARELVDNLDAIVWAVNPKNDSLDKFADYLGENVSAYLKMSAIRCTFDMPSELPAYPLSSEARHNLLLVVKEALHNTVKHAQASEVQVSMRIQDEMLLLTVADNGKGFPIKASSAFGNGLTNMEARMKNIGGHFDLTSQPGNGTRITLQFSIILTTENE